MPSVQSVPCDSVWRLERSPLIDTLVFLVLLGSLSTVYEGTL